MLLTNRLKVIADQINGENMIADIGTDHAYIPIYLVLNGICDRAICSDVKEGPYKIAQNNVRQYDLEDRIDVRLGSGFLPYQPLEADTAIIAGMGGEIIGKILEEGRNQTQYFKKFVLQPMTAIDELRLYLYQNGFNIMDEHLAKEGSKFYVILTVVWQRVEVPSVEYLYIGKKLLENREMLLDEYLAYLESIWERAILGMRKSKNKQSELGKMEYLVGKVRKFKNI